LRSSDRGFSRSETHDSVDVRPVSGAIGAEIGGVDLARDLPAETIAAIRRALLDHCVIFFRDQQLTSEQYLAFARRFGEPIEYPFVRGLDGFPTITPVVKLPAERVNFGGVWHADTTYLEEPPMATMLLAREVPPLSELATRPRRTARARAKTGRATIPPPTRRHGSSPSTRPCASIPRPGARRFTSTARIPHASRA
jgi:alpha-ketoglutarate-dependent taurine dioxygenase